MIDWNDYSGKFKDQASAAGKDEAYVDLCLSYAWRLNSQGLPIVFSGAHFSQLVGYETAYLYGASNQPSRYYRRFLVKKKDGTEREIAEPLPSLKEVQHWILENVLNNMPVSIYAKGFAKGSSTRHGARFHRKQPLVLNLDINKFFTNISYKYVAAVFREAGYSKSVTGLFTHLCLLDGGLPQGAPTSPYLANLVLRQFDEVIGSYCVENKIRYSRYADDMTFSGAFELKNVIGLVAKELSFYGLRLHPRKTKVMSKNSRQEVTGIVVNERINAPRDLRRQLRQLNHYIKKYGLNMPWALGVK